MRFLVDECTGPLVADWLRERGDDVLSIHDEAPGSGDTDVLKMAFSEGRILITNDKDFGEKVFRLRQDHCGVILLRLDDERPANKIDVLARLFETYGERLGGRFVVADGTRVRVVG